MRKLSLIVALGLPLAACSYETHDYGSSLEPQVNGDAGLPMGDSAVPEEEGASGDEGPSGEEGAPGEGEAELTGGIHHADPAVMSAVDAWRWRHETMGDVPSADITRCETRINDMEVVVPDHDEFRRLCHRCDLTDDSPHCDSLGRVNACAPWGGLRGEDGRVGWRHALVVLDSTRAADPVQRDRLVIHETIHHLGACTPAGPDSPHANDFWWCTDDASCISGRAWELLSQ